MEIVKALRARNLLKDFTEVGLEFTKKAVYCGFDPTGASLHLGHLPALNALILSAEAGYKTIALVGSATASVGDPSGRDSARPILTHNFIESNAQQLQTQLHLVLDKLAERATLHKCVKSKPQVTILDNKHIFNNLDLITFLREVGYHFAMNPLINRDFVKNRSDSLTFTEFTYSLMQAYDFYWLFSNKDCGVQIGGSDQWTNITAGTQLIRKKTGYQALGITLPLLMTQDGMKFGKTAGNALFLNSYLTSEYSIYQYCFNLPDDTIEDLLYKLTFLPSSEIEAAMQHPLEQRIPQKLLAKEIISGIHGEEKAKQAQRVSEILFSKKYLKLEEEDLEMAFKEAPKYSCGGGEVVRSLKESGVVETNSAARRLIKQKALKLNGKTAAEGMKLSEFGLIANKYLIVQAGKKNISVLTVT